MNKKSKLITVVIPCKDEEKYIGTLLESICSQSVIPYKIIIADNNSTDNTLDIIKSYSRRLDIALIPGGNVSEGRNKGAKYVTSKYICFIDADMNLQEPKLIEKTIDLMEKRKYEMITTNIQCSSKNIISKIVYKLNNFGQQLSKIINSPFSTGAFMCITKEKFLVLGGFDEDIQFCEDYWLSKQIKKSKFGIVNSSIYTSDRRFKKMGYLWMIKNFIGSYFNRNNREYFTKDFKYWI